MSKPTDGRTILREGGLAERDGVLIPQGAMPEQLEPSCPAARITRFQNTGRPAIHCGVAGEAFAVEDNPVCALGWCCGDYAGAADGNPCPVWVAGKTNDPALVRQAVAREAAELREQTRQQIIAGVRVDDRGVEAEEAQRIVDEAVEKLKSDPEHMNFLRKKAAE